jgi:hypothetical protein
MMHGLRGPARPLLHVEPGPEDRKLREHMKDAAQFHVTWGPEAHTLTVEERAKVLNDAFDQIARGDCEPLDFEDSRHAPKSKHAPMHVNDWLKLTEES